MDATAAASSGPSAVSQSTVVISDLAVAARMRPPTLSQPGSFASPAFPVPTSTKRSKPGLGATMSTALASLSFEIRHFSRVFENVHRRPFRRRGGQVRRRHWLRTQQRPIWVVQVWKTGLQKRAMETHRSNGVEFGLLLRCRERSKSGTLIRTTKRIAARTCSAEGSCSAFVGICLPFANPQKRLQTGRKRQRRHGFFPSSVTAAQQRREKVLNPC